MKNLFTETFYKIVSMLNKTKDLPINFYPTEELEESQKLLNRLFNLEQGSRRRAISFPFWAFWKQPIIKDIYEKKNKKS